MENWKAWIIQTYLPTYLFNMNSELKETLNSTRHERIPSNQRFKCIECQGNYSRKQSLNEHIATVHEGKKPYGCSLCDSKFTQNGSLRRHIASVHERKRSFQCKTCDGKFTTKQYLNIHIKSIHEENKSYQWAPIIR